MDKLSNLSISHIIDSISSSPIMILMKIFFINYTAMATTFGLNLLNFIGLFFSIKIDRFHLDAHSAPTIDQLSPTSTIKIQKDYVFVSVKLQQPHCEQSCHRRSKDHSHNYSIKTITDD